MAQHAFLPSLFSPRGDWSRSPLATLQGEIDRLFQAMGPSAGLGAGRDALGFSPSLDIAESADAIDITAELPGCDPKDVEISAAGRALMLRGEKKSESERSGKDWQVTERSYGTFQRTIPVSFDIDAATVEARFEKGVLTIHLPKPPEAVAERKTIPIQGP
ncbi:Hsp20/alpha crystallin family protein [Phreatobacter sp.]|uniref:Hsp20/alpha crystallin family protein n=1 Tax=Phreatobacter sp. TaxID=1966341 RepID=UPI0025E7F667|nr:Hsp20/alpha crystallin family protein [Phreatobacter sp.]